MIGLAKVNWVKFAGLKNCQLKLNACMPKLAIAKIITNEYYREYVEHAVLLLHSVSPSH